MRPDPSPVSLPVFLAGQEAARIMRSNDTFTVLAVFTRSLYLRAPDGDLVCLGRDDLEPGPLNALCRDWPLPNRLPRPGLLLRRQETELVGTGGAFRVSFAHSSVWEPTPLGQADPKRICAALERLAQNGFPGSPAEGLAPLLLPILHSFRPKTSGSGKSALLSDPASPPGPCTPQSALIHQAGEGLGQVQNWLRGREASVDRAVSLLLGLGPGLTPSGDDALAGVMLALFALQQHQKLHDLCQAVSRQAPSATNAISRAHLAVAARGMASAPVHDALSAVLAGNPDERTLARLGRVGHSSGWDALTGVILALGSVSQ